MVGCVVAQAARGQPGRTETMPIAVYYALETDPDAAIALSLVLLLVLSDPRPLVGRLGRVPVGRRDPLRRNPQGARAARCSLQATRQLLILGRMIPCQLGSLVPGELASGISSGRQCGRLPRRGPQDPRRPVSSPPWSGSGSPTGGTLPPGWLVVHRRARPLSARDRLARKHASQPPNPSGRSAPGAWRSTMMTTMIVMITVGGMPSLTFTRSAFRLNRPARGNARSRAVVA
jgi:hypothetical protein